jgi:hypothetical protein
MFQMSHQLPPVNGGLVRAPGMVDGSGTINPAALSSASKFHSQFPKIAIILAGFGNAYRVP